jgi:hypothetical protein
MWTCRKRTAGRVKSASGVTIWRETLQRWQDLQARDQLRQSFCTPGQTKRCETSFAVVLVPGCDRLWTDLKPWSCRGAGTKGRAFPADVSQYMETVVPGIGSFSSLRAVVDPRSAQSSSSASCDGASVSYDGGAVTSSMRERALATMLS